ncbi:MAG: NAD(P)H-dependent glycerol-3-phosphate dehydrogenase [Ruminococcus sp.]|nr:NAD(P)H-dependent glycerol-3-phosphate dehydrogenase [Ruminococcus sp.]
MVKITVLGSGGFGLSLAIMCDKNGHEVTVWSNFSQEIEDIKKYGEHKTKLPNVKVLDSIKLTTNMDCINGSDIVIFGIPSKFVRSVAKKASKYITNNMIIVNTAKGLEEGTHKRMSEVLHDEIPQGKIVILSGPSHAEEVARDIPTTVVVASTVSRYAEIIQEELSNPLFRIYVNNDIIGCEIGGSLKNIIALCSGISDGMGYGDNTKAALMTRGIAEMVRLGVALGAKTDTFSGLTGLGDLIVTCTSIHSRNYKAGVLIGQGISPQEAVTMVGTVEGYECCKVAWSLAKTLEVSMPITEQLYKILFEGESVRSSLPNLMGRPKRCEKEDIVF